MCAAADSLADQNDLLILDPQMRDIQAVLLMAVIDIAMLPTVLGMGACLFRSMPMLVQSP